MRISTKGRYALRVMLDLARYSGEDYVPLRDIAKRQELSIKYLEQIITQMNRAGFLRSVRGNGGGYRLAHRPSSYKVGDILRAAEGNLSPVPCVDDDAFTDCSRAKDCPTRPLWLGLKRVVAEYLDSVTLTDLLEQQIAAHK